MEQISPTTTSPRCDTGAPPLHSASSGNERAHAFVEEAKSIQSLLREYQERNEELKNGLSLFVRHEIDEQAQLAHLRATVNQAELSASRDNKYLDYVTKYAGAEQARPSGARSIGGEEGSGDASARPFITGDVWWAEKLRESNSPWGLQWLPDKAVKLEIEESVSQVWLGWRRGNAASAAAFRNILDRVYPNSTKQASGEDVRYCCFENGRLCTVAVNEATGVLTALQEKAPSIVKDGLSTVFSGKDNDPSTGLLQIMARVADEYNKELCDAAALSRDRFAASMWPTTDTSENVRAESAATAGHLRLRGDGSDTLSFLSPEKLRHTVTMRGFFFGGELGIVEQVGAEVDMSTLLLSAKKDIDEERCMLLLRAALTRTFRALHELLTAQAGESEPAPRSLVLTVALRFPADSDGLFGGTLLDVHPISPQLPFEGRISWMEVCAVGRQLHAARTATLPKEPAALDRDATKQEEVLFRLAYLPVACLQPYDDVSKHVFPLLNTQIEKQRFAHLQLKHTDGANRHEASPTGATSLHLVKAAFVCIGVTSSVAVVIALGRRLRRA